MKSFRVKFNNDEQKEFFYDVKNRLGCSFLELSRKNKMPIQTLKNYISGRCLMPISLFERLCSYSNIDKLSLNIIYLPNNWACAESGRKGMKSMKEKYMDQLPVWRSMAALKIAGKNVKNIKCPELNEKLSEFIGIYLGDGTITRYLVRISGDARYDRNYFKYISSLVRELFGLTSNISKGKGKSNTLLLTIYSKNLCSFLNQNYGISFGDKIKNQTCIPSNIMNNKKLALACLRGLVDTDGCISRRGRNGSQFCVQFFNGNKKLLEQVRELGFRYGFFSYFTGCETGTNKWDNVQQYFREVGSSNMKHIVRFNVKLTEGNVIYLREVINYYKKPLYKNIKLPFLLTS